MKKGLQLLALIVLASFNVQAQVTQLNSNKSLYIQFPLGNKALLISEIDSTIWATDATAAGTVQLSNAIRFIEFGGLLNNKLIFSATTAATGAELYITDGTAAGTTLLKDINPGAAGSVPGDDMAELNGYIYFTAETPAEGRELWRTDGTTAGTVLVKDITPGATSSNTEGDFDLFSTGSYLLMNISTVAEGSELWKSDGTAAGTILLKDINTGAASSQADHFHVYNNMVLFSAKTAANGIELWKTDGTPAGTQLVKDIRTGTSNSFAALFFYPLNGRLLFVANDGATGDEIWSTDGTTANTILLKDIATGPLDSYASLFTAINVGSRIIFSAFSITNGFELWESDGTSAGTKLFKDIVPDTESSFASIFPIYSFANPNVPPALFQGNKFFFMASTENEGTELWISDGTAAGTHIVKDIYPGEESGLESYSFVYTSSGLYFSANNGTTGNELWKSNGTDAGTTMVADINPGAEDSDIMFAFFMVNNKVIFQATNGDHATATDVYKIDTDLSPLPVQLIEFVVNPVATDAVLKWSTSREINSKDFVVQRSFDGVTFTAIGTVAATGNSSDRQLYNFTDKNILQSSREVIYYRLLLRDKDGKSTAGKVVALKIGNNTWGVKINSNPIQQNVISLSLSGLKDKAQLSVLDVSGRVLLQQNVRVYNGVISLPADNLSAGVYLLQVVQGSERRLIRFIKQ